MANPGRAEDRIGGSVRRALALIKQHPGVTEIGEPQKEGKDITVDVMFRICLPSEWRKSGKGHSGVGDQEEVRFKFPAEYPLRPPRLMLRKDFSRDLPHIQPYLEDDRPVPCIYDGDTSELFHERGPCGMQMILNQICDWLERAALGTLIDHEHGWEPVRRDSLQDKVIVGSEPLQALMDLRGGHKFFKMEYESEVLKEETEISETRVVNVNVTLRRKTAISHFMRKKISQEPQKHRGKSVALVAWAGKDSSGKEFVCDKYFPENVRNISDLMRRARLYGCERGLSKGVKRLQFNLNNVQSEDSHKIAVILLVRRPSKVMGSDSKIELCPYVIDVTIPDIFSDGESTTVRPAAHLDTVSNSLLHRMSGLQAPASGRKRWTLLGAGSLGSKIGMHLTRAGYAPDVIIDNSCMSPHNSARHALVPFWGSKAAGLAQTIQQFDQSSRAINSDVVDAVADKNSLRRIWPKMPSVIVNATASLTVREALEASTGIPARVLETSLYAGGRFGMITVEGPNRNPSTADLMAAFYENLQRTQDIRNIIFDSNASTRQHIGQGCGSMTMVMTDSRVSLFAATMSEYLLTGLRKGLPEDGGKILSGRLSEDGLGIQWECLLIPPTTVVQTKSGETWRVHIQERALTKMRKEVAAWPNVETGGVLMGRVSEAARVAHVVDVIDAPEDSIRSTDRFVLGKEQIRPQIEAYTERVNGSLYSLGTWHNHLSSCGPSSTDVETARMVSKESLIPVVFLIHTPAKPPSELIAFTAEERRASPNV